MEILIFRFRSGGSFQSILGKTGKFIWFLDEELPLPAFWSLNHLLPDDRQGTPL